MLRNFLLVIVCSTGALSALNVRDDSKYGLTSLRDDSKDGINSFRDNSKDGYKLLRDDSNSVHKSNTRILEELARRMEESDARIKVLEERDAHTTEQLGIIQDKLRAQEKENRRLQGIIENSKYINDASHDKTDEGSRIVRRDVGASRVAFTALLSADLHHKGLNQNVAFDQVLTNEGNAYNQSDGQFVAPISGTYVFSTTLTAKLRDVTHYGFALNGKVMTTIYVNGHEKLYDSAAQTIVLHLQTGDGVSVKHAESDKTLAGSGHSLFNGFLLYSSTSTLPLVG